MAGSVLEALVTSKEAFGLTTATPLQRAICRASDGVALGDLWENPDVRAGFGGVRPPEVAPKMMVIIAAIRSAKSIISAAKAFQTALTCDVSGLSPGDELRIPILSVDKDSAHQTFQHLKGSIEASPLLRQHLAAESTADCVYIRHQTGRIVEVKVQAIAKYGSTLVGRWLAGATFDEATRMAGSSDGVKNLSDSLHAIGGRIRPGAQIFIIGSPNVPFGPVFEMYQESFGRPSERIIVVHGTGPQLNPTWWNPTRVEWTRIHSPRVYQTDVLGKFADAEDQLFSSVVVDAAVRAGPEVIPPREGHSYVAAIDPAMRGNAWTLVILGCEGYDDKGEPRYYVALSKQWRGSKSAPLRPDIVLREIAQTVKPYGLNEIWSDGHNIDSLQVIAEQESISIAEAFTTQGDVVTRIENIRVLLEDSRLELSPDRTLRADLLRVRRKVNQKSVTMAMPVTADGRHCDFVPALGLCLAYPPMGPQMTARRRDPGLAAAVAAVDAKKAAGSTARSVFFGGLND
jgi:hypothetical protein